SDLLEQRVHLPSEPAELVAVERGQGIETDLTAGRQLDDLAPPIGRILVDSHESVVLDAPDELEGGVWCALQSFGELANRWRRRTAPTPDSQEELVLRWGELGHTSSLLGESREQSQRVAELGERLVLAVRQRSTGLGGFGIHLARNDSLGTIRP